MAFTIPKISDASDSKQSQIDTKDIEIIINGFNMIGVLTGCTVTAQGTPNNTVAVAAGKVINGPTVQNITGGNVTINSDGSNPRFVLVVAHTDSDTVSAIEGTPHATVPIFPSIAANRVVLAAIFVDTNDTTIETDKIIDKRVIINLTGSSYAGTGIIVSASNSSNASIQAAASGLRCSGTNDEVTINLAIDIAAIITGGRVKLTEGTFNTVDPIIPKSNVMLEGVGGGTILKLTSGAMISSSTLGTRHVIYRASAISNFTIKDLVVDGNAANQSDPVERNAGAACLITNVTNLNIDNVTVKNARSGAGILLRDCTDVKIDDFKGLTNGIGGSSYTCDHVYIGDSYRIKVSNFDGDTCTDTGLAMDGCRYVTVINPTIQSPGTAGGQCIAVGCSPTQTSGFITVGPGTLVGSAGTTRGVKVGKFGGSTSPFDITFTGLNISSVDHGISLDEVDRCDISNVTIKLGSATNKFGYVLGAGSNLVNINGGSVRELSGNAATAFRFETSAGALITNNVDLRAITNVTSGTVPAGTRIIKRNSGVTLVSLTSGVGTFAHGLGIQPTIAMLTGTVTGEIVVNTALDATNVTVNIKKHDNTNGTNQYVSWIVEKIYL